MRYKGAHFSSPSSHFPYLSVGQMEKKGRKAMGNRKIKKEEKGRNRKQRKDIETEWRIGGIVENQVCQFTNSQASDLGIQAKGLCCIDCCCL
jgi:hypothetical protein